jgi:hypothetical protein
VEQRLSLPSPTRQVAGPACPLDLNGMSSHGAPSPDLTLVVRSASAHVIATVPLEPSAGILRPDPSLLSPFFERLRGPDSEVIQAGVVAPGRKLGASEPRGGEFRAAIRQVLPAEHAELEHLPRGQLGVKVRMEIAPGGLGQPVAIVPLHAVVHDHHSSSQARQYGLVRCSRSRSKPEAPAVATIRS